jgi:II/X family phage/plasmid replication protein
VIDTVRLASPYLAESTAAAIEQACFLRSAVEISTGDVQYSLTTGSLLGSWDSRVSVRVEREEWVTGEGSAYPLLEKVLTGKTRKATVMKLPCAPYVVVEGSVHKALLGHNVYGGPLEPAITCAWFVDNVAGRLGVSLPFSEEWRVERIDWAEAYNLGSFEACQEYISGLNMAEYPRRQVSRYGSSGLMCPGRTTAFKVYHKGPEFSAHDRRRLRDVVDVGRIVELQEQANCILRLETEIKARKLAEHFGAKPQVVQLTRDWLEAIHDREAARLLKEARQEVETVRNNREVSRRLHAIYEPRLAEALYATWVALATLGEKEVRRDKPKSTWYRQKAQLLDAGVSWNGTNLRLSTHSAIPAGFSPVRGNALRMTDEAEPVRYALGMYNRPVPKDFITL